jgi:hypothetical protein
MTCAGLMTGVDCSSAIANITSRGACSLAAGTALAVAFVALCSAVSVAVGAVFHVCKIGLERIGRKPGK